MDQAEHAGGGGAQFPLWQPNDAEPPNHPWSDDWAHGNPFSADATDRPGRNDRGYNPGTYKAHHGRKLRHYHDMLQRESLSRSDAVNDASRDGFMRQRDQRLVRQV